MAERYWVGGSGTWSSGSTANWSAATPITISSASRSGNTLTTTGSPALAIGMTVWYSVDQYTGAFTSAGTITGGSGNTWTTSGSGTISSQQMYAATTGASVPTSADNVRFGAYTGSQLSTVTVSGPNSCLSFFHSGYIEFAGTSTPMLYVNQNFTMNVAPVSATFPVPLTFVGSNISRNFYSTGCTHGNVTFDMSGGSVTIQDNLTVAGDITLTSGDVTCAAAIAVTTRSFVSTGSNTRSLTFSTSQWTLNSSLTSVVWQCTGTNFTVAYSSGSSITFTSPYSVQFYGNGKSYPGLVNQLSGTGTTAGTNTLEISDTGNTFDSVSVVSNSGKSRGLYLAVSSTTYVTGNLTLTGLSSALVYLSSNATAYLTKYSGTVTATYTSITYISAGGGATFNAFTSAGNVNGGNNTGWFFSPPATGNFMAFF